MAAEALPYGLDVAGGERLRFSGAEVLIKASAETTGGSFSIVEEISPLDTPRHVHEREDELFFVLEGEHVFEIGDDEFRLGPGGLAFGPRGIPHAQRRVVPRTGRTLTMCSPAGFEGFFASSPTPRAQEDWCRRLCARLGALRRHLVVARSTQPRGAAAPQASASAASRALRNRSFSARVP